MKIVSLRPALALVLATGSAFSAQAQSPYVGDALNYSRLQFGGPARTLGIAGANVALGADFGNLTSNPAGLGLYQKSEFHFAPGLGLGSADASVNGGAAQTANKNSFHIASAGAVFANRRADGDSESGWQGGAFALGFTRLADYNQTYQYTNQATDATSFFQYLREPGGYTDYTSAGYQAAAADIFNQGNSSSNKYTSLEGLAYGNFLSDIKKVPRPGGAPGETLYVVSAPHTNRPITQNELVTNRGSLSQFDLAYGANYRNRLYLGGGVGIVSLNHERTSTFSESTDGAQDFEARDVAKTTGAGINARVGLIYRLSDVLRLGASIQTPTYIRLTDNYTTSLTVNQDFIPAGSGLSNSLGTAPGVYSYNIVTPFRTSVGTAVLLNKFGFLTGDLEYVGYQQARYSSNPNDANGDGYSFSGENQAISQKYKGAVNLRFGAEGRFDIFRVRLGYANYGSPYQRGSSEQAQQFYTAGLGLRQSNFFLDLAGVYGTTKQQYSPYTLASGQEPVANVTNNRYTTTVTAGFTF